MLFLKAIHNILALKPIPRSLYRHHIRAIDNRPNYSSRSRLLFPRKSKGTRREVEYLRVFRDYHRKQSGFNLVLLVAIRKDVELLTVAVEINTAYDLIALMNRGNLFFNG